MKKKIIDVSLKDTIDELRKRTYILTNLSEYSNVHREAKNIFDWIYHFSYFKNPILDLFNEITDTYEILISLDNPLHYKDHDNKAYIYCGSYAAALEYCLDAFTDDERNVMEIPKKFENLLTREQIRENNYIHLNRILNYLYDILILKRKRNYNIEIQKYKNKSLDIKLIKTSFLNNILNFDKYGFVKFQPEKSESYLINKVFITGEIIKLLISSLKWSVSISEIKLKVKDFEEKNLLSFVNNLKNRFIKSYKDGNLKIRINVFIESGNKGKKITLIPTTE
jgi:hypothetical protein